MFPILRPLADDSSGLERWCFEHLSKQFKHMSKMQIWDIVSQLQNNKNNAQRTNVSRKRKRSEVDDNDNNNNNNNNLDELFGAADTIYTCNECGGHDIINNQVQLRGADEPMTQFLFCQTCRAMWREE